MSRLRDFTRRHGSRATPPCSGADRRILHFPLRLSKQQRSRRKNRAPAGCKGLRRVTVRHRHRDRTRCLLSLLFSPLVSSLVLDGVVNLGWSRGGMHCEVRGLRSLYAGTARNRCDSCGSETERATTPQRPAPSDTEHPHHLHRASISACAHARHQPSAFPYEWDRPRYPPRVLGAATLARERRQAEGALTTAWPFARIACRESTALPGWQRERDGASRPSYFLASCIVAHRTRTRARVRTCVISSRSRLVECIGSCVQVLLMRPSLASVVIRIFSIARNKAACVYSCVLVTKQRRVRTFAFRNVIADTASREKGKAAKDTRDGYNWISFDIAPLLCPAASAHFRDTHTATREHTSTDACTCNVTLAMAVRRQREK